MKKTIIFGIIGLMLISVVMASETQCRKNCCKEVKELWEYIEENEGNWYGGDVFTTTQSYYGSGAGTGIYAIETRLCGVVGCLGRNNNKTSLINLTRADDEKLRSEFQRQLDRIEAKVNLDHKGLEWTPLNLAIELRNIKEAR